MSLDRERLAKLLGMTGSSFDAEALSAARRANELVREAELTWHEVLGSHHLTDKQLAVLVGLLRKVCPNVKVYPRRNREEEPF